MPRRVSLPAADDLFRPSAGSDQGDTRERGTAARQLATVAPVEETPVVEAVKRPSGRVRHDEKMTVYVTADELLDLEHARLSLRRSQGIAVDRGRLVRVAIAMALADLEANGADSDVVQRLTGD